MHYKNVPPEESLCNKMIPHSGAHPPDPTRQHIKPKLSLQDGIPVKASADTTLTLENALQPGPPC